MGCNPISTVTDFVGLTDTKGQEAAANASQAATAAAAKASKQSLDMTKEQLDFQKQQYNEWKDIYGDLQENLGNYYKNLSPDDYIAKGITAINTEYEAANKALTTQLAQRGISNSGIAAAALAGLEQQGASARANVRASADKQVTADKLSFLGLGLGQGTQMLGINAQVASSGASTLASMAGQQLGFAGSALGTAQKYSAANMDVMGSLVGGAANYATGGSFFKF